MIAVKVILASAIPDLPEKVQKDEMNRIELIKRALKEMRDIKIKGKYESFEEIQQKLEDATKDDEDDEDKDGDMFVV